MSQTERLNTIDREICMALKEAISDERAAPPMYRKLRELLYDAGVLSVSDEATINRIIQDEEGHEKYFTELAEIKGCKLSIIEPPKTIFADLPLTKRISLAKKIWV